jgi:membrane protease YdiL (CAAX protease family)
MLKRLFWHSEYRRLTMIPRVLAQLAVLAALFFPIRALNRLVRVPLVAAAQNISTTEAIALLSDSQFREISTVYTGLAFFSEMLVLIIGLLIGARFIDRRRFSDFNGKMNREWWLDLGVGVLIGGSLQTVIFLIAWLAGWVEVVGTFQPGMDGTSFGVGFITMLLALVCASIVEELLFRGYPIRTLSEGFAGLGPVWSISLSVLLTSAAFGFSHVANPYITFIIKLSIILGGIWAAAAYVLTGKLALPIGIHFAWNFAQFFFSFPVSGLNFGAGVIATEQVAYNSWIGTQFGPESGLLALCAIVIGFLLVLLYVKLRYGTLRIPTELVRPNLLPRPDEEHE